MPPISHLRDIHLAVMCAIVGIKQPLPGAIIRAVLKAGLVLESNEYFELDGDII